MDSFLLVWYDFTSASASVYILKVHIKQINCRNSPLVAANLQVFPQVPLCLTWKPFHYLAVGGEWHIPSHCLPMQLLPQGVDASQVVLFGTDGTGYHIVLLGSVHIVLLGSVHIVLLVSVHTVLYYWVVYIYWILIVMRESH